MNFYTIVIGSNDHNYNAMLTDRLSKHFQDRLNINFLSIDRQSDLSFKQPKTAEAKNHLLFFLGTAIDGCFHDCGNCRSSSVCMSHACLNSQSISGNKDCTVIHFTNQSQDLKRSSQENMRFPQWLNLLSIMLNSGLSLQRSLQICSRENKLTEKKSNSNRIDYFELEQKRMRLQITNGISPSMLLSDLSERCTIFQIKYVLDLIVRYERDGGKEILGIISLSTGSAWQVYRDELKKKLQSKNLLFLVPCGLSLVAVITTALIPAAAMLMVGN